ncbi:MAG: alpha/beta hydrolase [Arenimonas sp.]|nr:alpha/beta hydrolase [Arenimonas sp.]
MLNAAQWQEGGRLIEFNAHKLFTRSEGSGDALLLIHGFPTSSFDWSLLWPELATRFQLHTIDMLGFGLSDKPIDYAYSLKASADQWQAYVQSQGLKEVLILAHDYGDTVAQELLARQLDGTLPFNINKICLLNGGIFPEATFPILMQKLLLSKVGPLIARLTSFRRFSSSMRKICKAPLSDALLLEHWQLLSRSNGNLVLPKIIQYIRERRTHRTRWVGALQQASIPLCLINGVEDPISGASIVQRWRELLLNAPVVELQGVGHYPQWENPKQVLLALHDFL